MALRPEAIMSMENSIQNAATRKMMNNGNGEVGPKPKYKSIEEVDFLSPQKMQEWNSYIDYAKDKGFAGKAEIDKEGKGNKLFEEWKKQNPKTSISIEDMPSVRKSLIALRNESIENMKTGKGEYMSSKGVQKGPNADYSEFMRHVELNEKSSDPNYIGQHMTITKFPAPKAKIVQKGSGKVISETSGPLSMPGKSEQEMRELFRRIEPTVPKNP